MGSAFGKKKQVTQTILLTPPVVHTSGEVVFPKRSAKQTVDGAYIHDKNAPLYIRKLHTWAWENAHHHHTKKFTLPKTGTLVVRRGQPFKMTLTFNRPYNSLTDELKFFFETGDNPLPGNNTMVCLSSYTSQGSSGWKSDFLPVIGTKNKDCLEANLWIFTPADCIVSDWRFSLQTILRSETETATVTYEHPERIFILFNPWCKSDAVYLPAEPLLDEYVLNPAGILFNGCSRRMTVKPWIFGQFESGILEACIYIVKRGVNFRINQAMGDPVAVTRNISHMICDNDDGGIIKDALSCNDGASDGRYPTSWSGSVAILKQYLDNVISAKGDDPEPVKYGKSYVFAGLVATICRALGIPCRCVTSYNYAMGTGDKRTVDNYYELKDDGSIEQANGDDSDQVCSFHVWNDVWMKRSDLSRPCNESDWQALDATPRLSSVHDKQCCGPAPLYAVKNGHCDVKYDVSDVFAELHADVVHWLKVDSGDWAVFHIEQTKLGKSISSKTPDGRPAILTHKYNLSEMSRIRQDVTADYKYKKGTKMEKEIVQAPLRPERPMHKCKAKDLQFRLESKDYEYMGDDFNVKATVSSYSTQARTVHVTLVCESLHYNGKRCDVIRNQTWTRELQPGETTTFTLGVYESDYLGHVTDSACLRQIGYLRAEETAQIEACADVFLLQKPHLQLLVEEPVHKHSNFCLKLIFKNPLHSPLTNCTVTVEGTGLQSMVYIRKFENVLAQSEWTGIVNLFPVRSKIIELSATFHCNEMFDITGSINVSVRKEKERGCDDVTTDVTNSNEM